MVKTKRLRPHKQNLDLKLPKTIKVGAFSYKIIVKDKINHGEKDCLGLCSPDDQIIYIAKGLLDNRQRLLETLIHEVIHGIEDVYNVKLGEEKVQTLGMAIYGLLNENKFLCQSFH